MCGRNPSTWTIVYYSCRHIGKKLKIKQCNQGLDWDIIIANSGLTPCTLILAPSKLHFCVRTWLLIDKWYPAYKCLHIYYCYCPWNLKLSSNNSGHMDLHVCETCLSYHFSIFWFSASQFQLSETCSLNIYLNILAWWNQCMTYLFNLFTKQIFRIHRAYSSCILKNVTSMRFYNLIWRRDSTRENHLFVLNVQEGPSFCCKNVKCI